MAKRSIEDKRKKKAAKEINKSAADLINAIGVQTGQNLASRSQKYMVSKNLSADEMIALDEFFLGDDGFLRIMPVGHVEQVPASWRITWMHRSGYWIIPTVELVECLKEEIGEDLDQSIEIAAGAGVLGRALGIRSTDFMMAKWHPIYAEMMRRNGISAPNFGPWVERIEASEAVYRHKPRVVLGSYAIRRGGERLQTGIDEKILMETVPKFILLQPKKIVSAEFLRKATVLPVKVISKGEDAVAMVRVNKAARPMTQAESQFIVRLTAAEKKAPSFSVDSNPSGPESVTLTRSMPSSRRQI